MTPLRCVHNNPKETDIPMTHWMGNPNIATAPTCEEPGCIYASAHMWKSGPWFAFFCTEHFPTHEQARLDGLRGPR